MTENTIDTLAEFHMQHPDDAVYALMAHLINVLETRKQDDIEHTWRNVSNILGELESTRILHIMCQISHVDYLQLMQDCQVITLRHISPKLLLHLAILPIPYVSSRLQIDQYWASQLLDQFHKHFTIDDPIAWLKSFLSITQQEHERYGHDKGDLMMGRAVIATPKDTAEFRRTRWNRYKPSFRPPDT